MRAKGDPNLNLYGIFGTPLSHSISPAIQNAALDHYKLKAIYFRFERPPARFHFLMRNIRTLLLNGFNVTVPYKEAIVRYLDCLSPEAKNLGAVNTVKKQGSRWIGYNTDVYGFMRSLRESGFQAKNKRVVILGAGGSARAVAFALAQAGIQNLTVMNRTVSRAKQVVKEMKRKFPKINGTVSELNSVQLKRNLSETDLLVNATQVGLKPSDPLLVPKSVFPDKKIWVYDLIYKPQKTKLLKLASRLGHRTINGESMLLYQGAKAFEIWTGRMAPLREMKKALHDALHSD